MNDEERREEVGGQQELLAIYRRTLSIYLRQVAQVGSAYAQPATIDGIREARINIKRIKEFLRASGVAVGDHPDDEPQLANLENDKFGEILKSREQFYDFKAITTNTRQIMLLGSSLVSLFKMQNSYIRDEILNKQGASVQVLLLDPNSPSVPILASCIGVTKDYVVGDIKATFTNIELSFSKGIINGSLEVRLMRVYPHYNLTIVNPDKLEGRAFIELIGYQAGASNRPHIELLRQKDEHWMDFFVLQFEKLWRDAKPFSKKKK